MNRSVAPSAVKYVFQTVAAGSVTAESDLDSCLISTITPDRDGDSVIPEGGDFSNFMKSPVLMWAHGGTDGYRAVPIGSVTQLDVQAGKGITATWKWLEGDAFADRIKNAWKQGVIRATSIGFRPKATTPNGLGSDINIWELLELSLCAIPVNPEAVRAIKSFELELNSAKADDQGDEQSDPVEPVTPELVEAVAQVMEKELGDGSDPKEPADLSTVLASLASLAADVQSLRDELAQQDDDAMLVIEPDDQAMPDDPELDITAAEVSAIISEVLAATVTKPVAQEVQRAVARAYGRID